jgi:simple sugar transport system ATP-binding protein
MDENQPQPAQAAEQAKAPPAPEQPLPPGPDQQPTSPASGQDPAATDGQPVPMLEARNVTKYFGSVIALEDITFKVYAGEVACVLGDNGAGKSTLIKLLSGVHSPDDGELLVEGEPTQFSGPRDARSLGIATVFQDLATVPLMSVWRNFFLGNEPSRGWGPLQRLDIKRAQRTMRDEMKKMGIDVRDPNQTVGTLSGGERQAMAIARAVYFGAKVLILDEPTSALGVRQSGIVLKYIVQARAMGRAVIFITHNPHHAYPVGDRFVLLKRGRMLGSYPKEETSLEQLTSLMAGGAELEALSHELRNIAADPELANVAKELAAEAKATPEAQTPA